MGSLVAYHATPPGEVVLVPGADAEAVIRLPLEAGRGVHPRDATVVEIHVGEYRRPLAAQDPTQVRIKGRGGRTELSHGGPALAGRIPLHLHFPLVGCLVAGPPSVCESRRPFDVYAEPYRFSRRVVSRVRLRPTATL